MELAQDAAGFLLLVPDCHKGNWLALGVSAIRRDGQGLPVFRHNGPICHDHLAGLLELGIVRVRAGAPEVDSFCSTSRSSRQLGRPEPEIG
jgi:hypothetical protein